MCCEPVCCEPSLAENAALAYWQAFALLPGLTDEDWQVISREAKQHGPMPRKLGWLGQDAGLFSRQLRRGAAMPRCTWGTDIQEGPHTLLPHVQEAHRAARWACCCARRGFEEDRNVDAVELLIAVMALGRHLSGDGFQVALLVDYRIEQMAIALVAAYLLMIKAAELELFARRLQSLPKRPTLREVLSREKEVLLSWLERKLAEPDGKAEFLNSLGCYPDDTPACCRDDIDREALAGFSQEELVEAAAELWDLYEELAMADTKEDREVLWSEKKVSEPVRYLTEVVLPSGCGLSLATDVSRTELAMLKAAVAVVQRAPTVLEENQHGEPVGGGPFEYLPIDFGFRLRSRAVRTEDGPVCLTFGHARPSE